MTSHHAAALALLGWYLMTPPIEKTAAGYKLDHHAPLSHWELGSSYDSAGKCQEAAHYHSDHVVKVLLKTPGGGNLTIDSVWENRAGAGLFSFTVAKCIATDDPRLAK